MTTHLVMTISKLCFSFHIIDIFFYWYKLRKRLVKDQLEMDSFKNDCHSADGANPALLGDHSVDFEKIFASFLFLEFFQHLSILKENKTKSRRVIQVNAVHLDDNRGQWWWYQKKISYWTCLVLVDIRNGFQPAFIDRLGENTSVRNSWSMTYLLYSILFFWILSGKIDVLWLSFKKALFLGVWKTVGLVILSGVVMFHLSFAF